MEGDEMELIAQLLLKSRIDAYIEWLDNKLIMAANNNINKDSLLDQQTIKLIILLRVGKLFSLVR